MSDRPESARSAVAAGPAASPAPPSAGLTLGGVGDVADLAAFCARVLRLDPRGLVRLRGAADRTTAYSRLPLDVLVSRTVHSVQPGTDRTYAAHDLLAALDRALPMETGTITVAAPAHRDTEWRGMLPLATGWRRLEVIPAAAIERTVRAGMAAFESARGGPGATVVGEALLDHEALRVDDGDRTVILPLRVLHAAWRMGFLGAPAKAGDPPRAGDPDCGVSVAGGWVRLAAPYGSVYHRRTPALALGARRPSAPTLGAC
ncbi:MAG TPA: hypothetical protein VLJ59_02315 [Mycobacteriales bacterium]|nr:hypothetical protein [Mycobacteriales bacterium]